MAPSIHPPCTPTSSCAPPRCHPSLPECSKPEKCLKRTIKRNIRPCQSAAAIMATRAKASCGYCNKYSGRYLPNPRKAKLVVKYLRRKTKERRMRRCDWLKGTHHFERYKRRQGTSRSARECCAGKGHRGRVQRPGCLRCCMRCCGCRCCQKCCCLCCLDCCRNCCVTCCKTKCSPCCAACCGSGCCTII